ncbi:histidinol-phosphatase [Pelagibius litoralis]|uniref:Histidinol-phosphatase n=1 Tax=Pelagibius litoralis TaxID=374515 RepID=A0A967F1F5_9PROT|nr:histidinol-phosphatase [Pelagibius litoralis]NIA71302.1 histidinol-phosphatase [Pelagibius litoralis]
MSVTEETCSQEFIDLAGALATTARGIARQYFRQGLAIEDKADESPVTRADREAEAAMRKLIGAAYPDHGIFGEEYGAENPDADFVWVLDPIDGTRRFITGNPLFGSLIALLHHNKPILGVIDMPILEERWLGIAGRPSLFTDRQGSREARVRPCPQLAGATILSTAPEMFQGANGPAFQRLRDSAKLTLYGGDCFNYGLLASGFADIVVEADLAPYDYLAHAPIVAGAGGVMSDWQGAPLTLQSDGRVLCAGDPACHDQAVALLRTA